MSDDTDSDALRIVFCIVACVLSLTLAGLGHAAIGKFKRGLFTFLAAFVLWFVLLGWIVHLWAIYDSVASAYRGDIRWFKPL